MSQDLPTINRTLRIGTRKSELALWQANWISDALRKRWGDSLKIEIVKMTTEGDEILDRPLYQVGGKGLFVNGIEEKLLAGEIDLAVHSMKDLPSELPDGLIIACTPEREDARDVMVGAEGQGELRISKLPAGTRIGTSSLRRSALLRRLNSGLEIVSIRGNVPTRIAKIERGEVDYVVLALAGLKRLQLESRAVETFELERFCPAPCQGILAVECRDDAKDIRELLTPLNDVAASIASQAERAFLRRLDGGCQIPLASYAELRAEDILTVNGLVIDPSGRPCFMATKVGHPKDADQLGSELADTLIRLGAGRVVETIRSPVLAAC